MRRMCLRSLMRLSAGSGIVRTRTPATAAPSGTTWATTSKSRCAAVSARAPLCSQALSTVRHWLKGVLRRKTGRPVIVPCVRRTHALQPTHPHPAPNHVDCSFAVPWPSGQVAALRPEANMAAPPRRAWARRCTSPRCSWGTRCSTGAYSCGTRAASTWGRSTWTRAAGAGSPTATGTACSNPSASVQPATPPGMLLSRVTLKPCAPYRPSGVYVASMHCQVESSRHVRGFLSGFH